MRKALVVVLALMGLPLGLEAQGSSRLRNAVIAARECTITDKGREAGRRAGELLEDKCVFTLGRDLKFATINRTNKSRAYDFSSVEVEIHYKLPNGDFDLSVMNSGCSTLYASFEKASVFGYDPVYIQPKTGDVYTLADHMDCLKDG